MARNDGTYNKIQSKYANPILLIIDEWLLLKPTESEQHDILELLHRRRKKSSTVFCSQYDCNGWYDQLGGDDSPLSEAILNRIKHDAYKINSIPNLITVSGKHCLGYLSGYFIKFPINFCIKFVIEFIWMLYIHRPFLLNLKSVSCSKFKSGGDRLLLMPLIMRTDFLSGHQIRQTCGLLAGNQNFRATKKAPPGC
ncbi:ATP-binding protein [Ruminococcus sp. 2227st1_E6_2227SCRN_220401]|uniref:ATP-binding protein n=1 Tax=unclassified Ruminococcus TaxID=2608920 RepID=UPI00319E3F35